MHDIPVKDIMVTQVITVDLEDPFHKVMEKLRDYKIRHLPVVDKDRKVVGMITHRDLLHTISPRKTEEGDYYDEEQLDRFILKNVMTPDPVCVGPEESIVRVIDIMARDKYGCIPVVALDHTLMGIVTQIDILKFLAEWLRRS